MNKKKSVIAFILMFGFLLANQPEIVFATTNTVKPKTTLASTIKKPVVKKVVPVKKNNDNNEIIAAAKKIVVKDYKANGLNAKVTSAKVTKRNGDWAMAVVESTDGGEMEPLAVVAKKKNGKWVALEILMSGNSCLSYEYPGLFTKQEIKKMVSGMCRNVKEKKNK